MHRGSQHLLDNVQQDTSASMLPGQTNLKIMTTLHLVTVYALQTLRVGNVRRDFSALKDPTNPLPVLVDITAKVNGRMLSLDSVTQVGFVPAVQRSHSLQMASPETSVQRESIASGKLQSQSSAPREHFQITLGTAMKAIVQPALKDRIVKLKD